MIPDFEKTGFLPTGIHEATIAEFEKRFANTIWRKQFFPYLLKLMTDLRGLGIRSIYINGSYTTNERLPNDMDICWEDTGIDYNFVEMNLPILFDLDYPRVAQQLEYKADIFPAHLIETSSGMYFIDFFQRDKYTNLPKGIIKINI